MRILHLSDTHGVVVLPSHVECDLVVHSGDLLPNQTRGPGDIGFQKDWCTRKLGMLRKLALHARYGVLYVPGNHDWFDPGPLVGAPWRTLIDDACTIASLTFYGLPYIPAMGGFWNYERLPSDLSTLTEAAFSARPDVLVAHCPPMYCGDTAWTDFIGNPALTQRLVLHPDHGIRYVLCGHNHEQAGFRGVMGGAQVINSATTMQIVDIG